MRILIYLFIVIFMSCNFQTNINKKVVIKYVDYEIMTPFNIGCNNFTSFFGDEVKTIEIMDNTTINKISTLINKLEEDPEKYYPDVRLTIELINDNKIDTLCMSHLGISLNGKAMKFSDELLNFIETIKNPS